MYRSGETYGSEFFVRIFVIQVRANSQTKSQWGSRNSCAWDSYATLNRFEEKKPDYFAV